MKIEKQIILTLNEEEISALKTLLGGLNDPQKKEAGCNQEQISLTSNIWDALPYQDDE